MSTKTIPVVKKKHTAVQNPLEAIKDAGSKIGSGMFDQLVGRYDSDDFLDQDYFPHERTPAPKKQQPIKEFSIFSAAEHQNSQNEKREIQELTAAVKEE